MIRSTLVVDGPLALRMQRLEAAREGAIGREIMTLPLMAARLAGGFAAAAGSDVLYPGPRINAPKASVSPASARTRASASRS